LGRARLSLENGLSALEVSRRFNLKDLFDKCRKFICPFMLDPAKLSMNGIGMNYGALHSEGSVGSKSALDYSPPHSPEHSTVENKFEKFEKLEKFDKFEKREEKNEKIEKIEKITATSARVTSQNDNSTSVLTDKIKKHLEDLEQPKNQSSMVQPANMLINKRVLPSRLVKSSSREEEKEENLKSEKIETKSPVQRLKPTRSKSPETITPSSSDNDSDDSSDETVSHMTESDATYTEQDNDSDHSTATTSSLGSLASKERKTRPRRQKSVKWV
jgi:hypothetical protein